MKNRSFQSFTQILEYIIKYFKFIVIFAVILVVVSGIYVVDSGEVAVVLRFGRLVGSTPQEQIREPGLHFALPFFIDEIVRIPVHTVHEREVTTHFVSRHIYPNVEWNGYLLTGDNNIVLIRATVRYQISNAAQYTLFNSDVGSMIDGIVSGELTRTVANMDIDTVLTTGRAELALEILNNSQVILDAIEIGVAITSVDLTDILPPWETLFYFEDVRSAAVEMETSIQQAREQAQVQILSAQAEATAARQTSISEQAVRLTSAHNVMAEFNGLYDQFVIDPEIIMAGTFRQRIGAILAQSGGTIIIPDESTPPTIILP